MKQKTITKSLLLLGTVLTGLFVSLNHSSSVSAYSLTVSTSGSVTANVMPSADGGIGTTVVTDNVNIISNCRAGYTMTIAGPTDNNLYLNGDSTNNTSGTYFSPVNGTSALNNSANVNKWGYSLTTNSGTGVFSALSSTATTLFTPSQTASPDNDIDTTIPVYYGTAVNTSMAPGSYTFSNSNSITYSVVMDTSCTSYSVQYQDNGADNPNGMGTTDSSSGEKSVHQINIVEDTKITLLAPNFKKAGYAFLGWSTDQNAYTYFTDNDNTNDPVIYGPNEDVVIDADIIATADSRNQINMYAVWIPALKDGSNNPVYMQEWDNPNTTLPHDGCSTLTATVFDDTVTDEKGKITVTKNSIVALTDKRDNMIYAVARLADGNCWMTENLRLEHDGTVGDNTNDSNTTNQSLSQGYGGTTGIYGNFVGLAEPESENFSNPTTSNSIYKSDGSGDAYDLANNKLEDIGTSDYPDYRFPRYNSNNTQSLIDSTTYTQNYANASNPSDSGTNYRTSSNLYSYGNYYTWAAAMANLNRYISYSASEVAGTSICPSGWHLPSSSDATKEYGTLSQSYGGNGQNQNGVTNAGDTMSNRFRSFPNNFLYSGYFGGSSAGNRGTFGGYYSRSAYGNAGSYHLAFASTSLNPASGSTKYSAFSARCLIGSSDVEIILDSNNGTGAISRIYGQASGSVSLPYQSNPSASIAQLGYGFKNWNTAPDGSGTSYTSSFTIPANSTGETLYAQWTPQYTITYVDNCMSWASGDSNCDATKSANNSTQKIGLDGSGNGSGTLGAYNKFTMTGWKIKEWATNADGTGTIYPVSSTYVVTGANPGDSITLYAHWVPTYSVQYDGNGSDNDSTGMGSTDSSTGLKSVRHTNVGEGDTFDLFASNFKKAGYGFVGWSLDANAWNKLTDNDATNDVRIWGPNEIFTAPTYNGTTITTLYAIWAPAETSGGNPVYLQNWTGCSSMTATTYNSSTGTLTVAKNSVTALTDQRDNEVYAVAKLADGNCWMIENLRLADTHEENGNTVATTLSTSNTNILPSNNTLPITNIYNTDPSLATKSNSLSPSSSQSNTDDPSYGWCFNDAATCNDQSRLNTANTVTNTTPSFTQNVTSANDHANFNRDAYSYGNYYNWYSATAGYGTQSMSSGVTDGDLCPSGWHLPYGGNGNGTKGGKTSGGFAYLDTKMDGTGSQQSTIAASNKWRAFPNNYVYPGYVYRGSVNTRGQGGYYWSSTPIHNGYPYAVRLNNNVIYPGTLNNNSCNGWSVRCVASPSS